MRKNFILAMTLSLSIFAMGAGASYADETTDVSSQEFVFVQEKENIDEAESKNDKVPTKIDELIEINNTQPVETKKQQASAPTSASAERLIEIAKAQLGKPYSYGSAGPNGFDCSGFTTYVFGQMGISLPRVASSQAYGATNVSKAELQKGDLVFFNTYGGISHVGIYVENGTFIHSSSYSGGGVKYDNIDSSYYAPRFVTGARYL